MNNCTSPSAPSEDQSRAAAKAALKEKGWELWTPGCWSQGELAVGCSTDQRYKISIWTDPNPEPGTPWRCDVGVTPPDSEKEALWMHGIPRPDEVPTLLEKYADILSVGCEGRILDLASGEVFCEGAAHRLQETPSFEESSRQSRAEAFWEVIRALDKVGFSVWEIRPGEGGEPDRIIAERWEN